MSKPSPSLRGRNTAHTDLLIKNLRMLDLDEEFDWPKIQLETFAVTSTIQEQKERVRCGEWILYKLFELWNPQEVAEV